MTTLWTWLGLAVGGGVGAVLRLLVDGAVTRRSASALPVGTLAVNLSGALVLGLLDGAVLPPHAAMVVGTGLVGAYTTFSTWMFETQRLAEERQLLRAAGNLAVSVVAGVAVAVLGLWIGGQLR
ncbi:MAG TPA: fluoride efflux transporter CrcB [Marmoricola sp.]|nr:fluoride efflux transporter CrcB [Marmoricola sp.]